MTESDMNVSKAINLTFKKLKANPFLLWSEFDLQTLLSIELSKFDSILYETKLIIDGYRVRTNRVHREYICYIPKNDIDIVVFSMFDIKNINDTKDKYLQIIFDDKTSSRDSKNYRPVECSHLIEIKTNLSGTKGAIFREVKHDFEKLRKTYKMQEFKPELHYVLFIRWNIKNTTAKAKQKFLFENLLIEINKNPKVQFHLLAWPEKTWKKILQENYELEAFLEYFD